MKTKFLGAIILFAAFFTACKNDKPTEGGAEAPAPEPKGFKIILRAVVAKDDNVAFFYTEDGTIDFSKIQPVWVNVKGSSSEQDIVCFLPEDAMPTQLRIDPGINPEQDDIIIKSITFENEGIKRVITGAEIGNFFRADENTCTFDPVTGIVRGITKDGAKKPSLYPQEAALGEELKKI